MTDQPRTLAALLDELLTKAYADGRETCGLSEGTAALRDDIRARWPVLPTGEVFDRQEHEELWSALTDLTTRTTAIEVDGAAERDLTVVQVAVDLTVNRAERQSLDGDEMREDLSKNVELLRKLARMD